MPHPSAARLVMIAELTIAPGKMDGFLDYTVPNLAVSRSQPGNLCFDMLLDRTRSDRVLFYKEWDSAAAQQAYMGWRTEAGDLTTLMSFLAGTPTFTAFAAFAPPSGRIAALASSRRARRDGPASDVAAVVRRAIRGRHVLQLAYRDGGGGVSERRVMPLGIWAFTGGWLPPGASSAPISARSASTGSTACATPASASPPSRAATCRPRRREGTDPAGRSACLARRCLTRGIDDRAASARRRCGWRWPGCSAGRPATC